MICSRNVLETVQSERVIDNNLLSACDQGLTKERIQHLFTFWEHTVESIFRKQWNYAVHVSELVLCILAYPMCSTLQHCNLIKYHIFLKLKCLYFTNVRQRRTICFRCLVFALVSNKMQFDVCFMNPNP